MVVVVVVDVVIIVVSVVVLSRTYVGITGGGDDGATVA